MSLSVAFNAAPLSVLLSFLFFFKQKTAYEMRISDWSSDVCSSDLPDFQRAAKIAILAKLRGSQPLVEQLCTQIAAEASADTLPRQRQYRSSIGLPSAAQGSGVIRSAQ